jgi:hypothetical protein
VALDILREYHWGLNSWNTQFFDIRFERYFGILLLFVFLLRACDLASLF